LEQIELNVEFTVATPVSTFLFPHFPLSKAISITFYTFKAASGTHKVFPLFAINCKRIFVAMLRKPFFFSVPYVAI
jgi:phage-related holin